MPQIQYSFQRKEKKYILTPEQAGQLVPKLQQYMTPDEYGVHTVCNLYYDTEDFELIRTSLEKPPYKEKFRVRSYGTPEKEEPVFAEIKKKCDGVVYKRRVAASSGELEKFLQGEEIEHEDSQIQREIHWFLKKHRLLEPRVFIAYERAAFIGKEDPELRITFDWNIRWRTDHLNLCDGDQGNPVMDEKRLVMEIKLPDAAPLWLAELLSEEKIYPASFSKYGVCYQRHLIRTVNWDRQTRAAREFRKYHKNYQERGYKYV